jgi:bacillopeptidase F (M6 metalloprotease family)
MIQVRYSIISSSRSVTTNSTNRCRQATTPAATAHGCDECIDALCDRNEWIGARVNGARGHDLDELGEGDLPVAKR